MFDLKKSNKNVSDTGDKINITRENYKLLTKI